MHTTLSSVFVNPVDDSGPAGAFRRFPLLFPERPINALPGEAPGGGAHPLISEPKP